MDGNRSQIGDARKDLGGHDPIYSCDGNIGVSARITDLPFHSPLPDFPLPLMVFSRHRDFYGIWQLVLLCKGSFHPVTHGAFAFIFLE